VRGGDLGRHKVLRAVRAVVRECLGVTPGEEVLVICNPATRELGERLRSEADDVLCVTFNGLSKSYRLAGFRSGWMVISGAKQRARSYVEGLEMLASMRLCANVPAMYAVQTALGGYQSIRELVTPGGRLYESRRAINESVAASRFFELQPIAGAMYAVWALTLHVPLLLEPRPTAEGYREEFTSFFVCVAFWGAAWIIAAGLTRRNR
jgi:aspartate/methionine/tyrosine aminotransferase